MILRAGSRHAQQALRSREMGSYQVIGIALLCEGWLWQGGLGRRHNVIHGTRIAPTRPCVPCGNQADMVLSTGLHQERENQCPLAGSYRRRSLHRRVGRAHAARAVAGHVASLRRMRRIGTAAEPELGFGTHASCAGWGNKCRDSFAYLSIRSLCTRDWTQLESYSCPKVLGALGSR